MTNHEITTTAPRITSSETPLQQGRTPLWAAAHGRDEFGDWVTLSAEAETGDESPVQRMRWIPPGEFTMGSPGAKPRAGHANENPASVSIDKGFWMGDTPVTQRFWTVVMGSNPSRFIPGVVRGEDVPIWERPVEQVSFRMVESFLERLRMRICEQTNRPPDEFPVRLPREHEWEWACRALGDDLHYGVPDGLTIHQIAWCVGNAAFRTQAVAQLPANRWGCYDMLGNVWEWCADEYRKESNSARAIPRSDKGVYRVLRGGSWAEMPERMGSATRSFQLPGFAGPEVGVRLVVSDVV